MARPVAVPLTISLLLHGLIVLLLALNLHFSTEPKVLPPQPNVIEAKLVKLDAIPSAKPAPAPKPVEAPPKPVVEPAPKPEPEKNPPPAKPELSKPEPVKPPPPVLPTAKPEPPKPPKPDLDKQKQIDKQKLVEKEQADAVKKAEQQKQEIELKRKEQETQRKVQEQQEAARKKQQDDLARKQREQMEKAELAKAMASEENAMAAANAQEAVTSYMALIQRAIQNNWNRPANARNDMRVVLSIQMIPTGEIVDVAVVKSSGNDAFDRSAVAAVKKTAQIPELKELSSKSGSVFDKNFRRFQLDFHPEDLRQ